MSVWFSWHNPCRETLKKVIVSKRTIPTILFVILLFGLLLSACQPAGETQRSVFASSSADLLKVNAENCDYGGKFKSIEAVDPYTVKFTLCSPDSAFVSKVAFPVFVIQDQEVLEAAQGQPDLLSANVVGTGPYRLKSSQPGTSLELVVNPVYWGVPAKNETLVFDWRDSPVSRLAAAIYANTDGYDRPDPNSFFSIRSDPSLSIFYRPALNVGYLGFNNKVPPFNREVVRKAFAMLIDRQKIVDSNYPVGSEIAQQFLPASMGLGYTPGYRWLDYNPKEGLDLLEQTEFDFNQTISLAYTFDNSDYLPNQELIAVDIKAQLNRVGIKVELKRVESSQYLEYLKSNTSALFLYGLSADYPDPSSIMNRLWIEDAAIFGNDYSDIQFTAQDTGKSADLTVRQQRFNRINELIRLHVPAVPLGHGNSALVFNKNVEGVIVGPMNENFEEMSTSSDVLRFTQTRPPKVLWPANETDLDTLRITRLLYSTLAEYDFGGTGLKPGLAEYWESNPSVTEWTFHLRYGVQFTNGSALDANDVVASFAAMWDASNPNHAGNYPYFQRFFGNFINQ